MQLLSKIFLRIPLKKKHDLYSHLYTDNNSSIGSSKIKVNESQLDNKLSYTDSWTGNVSVLSGGGTIMSLGPKEQERLRAYCHGNPPVFAKFLQLYSQSQKLGNHVGMFCNDYILHIYSWRCLNFWPKAQMSTATTATG